MATLLFTILLSSGIIAEEQLSIFASPDKGKAPLDVNFAIQASVAIDGYAWDFTSDGTIDSTEPSPTYTYSQEGEYDVTFKTTANGEEVDLTTTIIVRAEDALKVSIAANPAEGVAPLTVQFTAAAIGQEPLTYAWDFNNDGSADSFSLTPTTTFSKAGKYSVQLAVSDKNGETVKKNVQVLVSPYDSRLTLKSYFPTNLTVGENTVTFILENKGTEEASAISAKIIGNNIQQTSSTTIAALEQDAEDSLTIGINVLQEGPLNATLKVADKSFPLQFTARQSAAYSKEELQAELQKLKDRFNEQEAAYYEKKAQGYLVSEFSDAMKNIKEKLQEAQLQILTEKGEEAKVTMNLAAIAVTDFQEDLSLAKKEKVEPLRWLKENALAITAIIAAFGTLSGILIKLKHHAVKVTGTMAGKAKELVKSKGNEREKEENKKGKKEEKKEKKKESQAKKESEKEEQAKEEKEKIK